MDSPNHVTSHPAVPTGVLELAPDLIADVRRAVWLPRHHTLVVPDVHLGFSWVQRQRGQLLPIAAADGAFDRLGSLQQDYAAERIVFLGDLVHAAADIAALRQSLAELVRRLSGASGRKPELLLVLGNHDHRLPALLCEWNLPIRTLPWLDLGRFRLLHGHEPAPVEALEPTGRLLIIGHEHPSLELGDGVASRVKCPAFALADDTLVVPAFSDWAAGCNLHRREFLGPIAHAARFHTVVACMGPRLLKLPFARISGHCSEPDGWSPSPPLGVEERAGERRRNQG